MKQFVGMNKLLDSLPLEEMASIGQDLEPVSLRRGQCLYRYGDPTTHVFFPGTTIASLVCLLPDGKSSEIGMVGPESGAGLPTALGPNVAAHTAEALVSGRALKIRADALKRHYDAHETFRRQVTSQLWLQLAQSSRLASCNLYHQIPERLCRWLLTLQDRSSMDEFQVTHEQIADRLGIRRSGVTIQLGSLEELGAIELGRRRIKIVRRELLRRISCECYERSAQEANWASFSQREQGLSLASAPRRSQAAFRVEG
jgi:CRP-like cAMP-binding protein